jgi:aspartyl-tRNA(Asn)/glutamyl-tRNA(Gln) amidotransferase subunit C
MATDMEKITIEDVEKLAKLARVGLKDNEKQSLASQMTEILNYVKQLDEIDTSSVEPTSQTTGLSNVYVEDAKEECCISRDDLLSNAPQQEDGFIKVKSVLE